MIKLFVGVPGAGKSLAMQDTVRALNRVSKLGCAIVDRTNEWALLDKDGAPNERWRGDPPRLTLVTPATPDSEIRAALIDARDSAIDGGNKESPEQQRKNATGSVVFQQIEPHIVGEWVRRIGYLCYVDDEIDLTARKVGWDANPLRAFVHTGRHLPNEEGYPSEVHILGACRRVQNIHTDLTELADEAFIFRSQGANTFKRMLAEGWVDEEDIDSVRTQPNLSFHKWQSDGTKSQGFIISPQWSKPATTKQDKGNDE